MALETGTYISDLNVANPASSDGLVDADNHMRLIKSTLKTTFPNITGIVSPTQVELNYIVGATSSLQTQATTNASNIAINTAAIAGKASLASPAFTGVPTAPTATPATNSTQVSTTAYVDAATAVSTVTAARVSDAGAVGRTILQAATAPVATALLSTMVASGASHAAGLVPDPGVTAGTTKFLREDGTFALPTVSSGETVISKATADARTTATLTNDTDFTFSMLANTNYLIRVQYGFTTSTNNGGLRIAITGPATPTSVGFIASAASSSAGAVYVIAGLAQTSVTSQATYIQSTAIETGGSVFLTIRWKNGANAGTFAMQTAQLSAAGNTTLTTASSMSYQAN